ncbi:TetR/AcrR family transcriptional regulator [Pseudodesulfovibrio sediminis]|uniref:HTH tetR-type domain-containing protein n=1 Tax=Pseudodesulfovibrio sediminis TaxID=2810563 RepID=A0ABN6EVY1_9BACT|nr:TetR/AcrR family transcriptional regulator [Pseudodesulfovibrio sediminis]BCS89008.1 hypothetical protein PSDVSF_22500 [Pseudodesulfovibrio sediminis]
MEKIGKRDRQKQETRRQIQEAARSLITRCGYKKTTMRALAEEAGVGLGTIGLHFNDKKSLLFSTFYDEIGGVAIKALESVPENGNLRQQFLHLLRAIYSYYGEHTIFLRSVVKEALFAKGQWREKFGVQIEAMIGLVAALIEAAKERGEVRQDVNPYELGHVCWALYLNTLIGGLSSEEFDVEAMVAQVSPLLDVVLHGVLV